MWLLLLLLLATWNSGDAFTNPSPAIPTIRHRRAFVVEPCCVPSPFPIASPIRFVSLSSPPEEQDNDESSLPIEIVAPSAALQTTKMESWEADSKVVELMALAIWGIGISAFIFMNNFVGPWPAQVLQTIPERLWFWMHMLGGMLFGGGVILTTAIEWLVVDNKNASTLQFWFDKVPLLDAAIVLPALTLSMISGTGLCVHRYHGLGLAPPHIQIVFYTLVSFAAWWAATDLSTQGQSLIKINEWALETVKDDESHVDAPDIVKWRRISNIVSCLFVVALYGVMVMKPGTIQFW